MVSVRPRVALLTTVVLWAVAFPAIRVGLDGLGPVGLATVRLCVASVCLGLVAPFVGVRRPATRDLPLIVVCGLTGIAGYNLLLNWGELTVAAGTASFIVVTNPIYSALLAVVFLKERMSLRQVIGAVVAIAGIAAITLTDDGHEADSINSSAFIVVCAAVAFGVYHVAIKPLLNRYSGLEVTAYATWTGTLLLIPAVPTLIDEIQHAGADAVTAAALLGLAPSALGLLTWAYAVARLPVTVATGSLYLIPPLAVAVGYVWLGEVPQATQFVGGIVAIAGVAYSNSTRPRDRPPPGSDYSGSATRRCW